MSVGIRDDPDALAFLGQIPAADSLVVCNRQKMFTAWMKSERTNPVVMAHKRFDKIAPRIP
jgi:hypothetical protein